MATDAETTPALRRWATPCLVLAVFVVVATRVLARQATPWEWDDLVFRLALDVFAPQSQVPQPPFYPGFVLLGRLARVIVADNHAALTWLSVAASSLVPAFCLLVASGLGFSRRVGLTAAALLAFFPAVWFHSGVPLSDPTGLATGLGAMALALRAGRNPRIAVLASLALGVAVSVRPQSALPAAVALAVSSFSLTRRQRLGVAIAAVTSVGLLYLGPILVAARGLSGVVSWTAYQASFVLDHDSLAAHHWAIPFVLRRYFLDIWADPSIAIAVLAFSLLGAFSLWREHKRRRLSILLVIFLPYAFLSWVFLDPSTAGRYSLPYLPLVSLLTATGASWFDDRLGFRRVPVAGVVLVVTMAAVSTRAVLLIHQEPSPPVMAARAILEARGTGPYRVAYSPLMRMHAHAFFPDADLVVVRSAADLCSLPLDEKATWLFGVESPESAVASWPDFSFLREVGRGRYREVRWRRQDEACLEYAEGFFQPERAASGGTFRWMGSQAVFRFRASGADAQLGLSAEVPLWALDGAPEVRISLNGQELQNAVATGAHLRCDLPLPSDLLRGSSMNEVVVSVSKTFIPAELGKGADRRRLGLRILEATVHRPGRVTTRGSPPKPVV